MRYMILVSYNRGQNLSLRAQSTQLASCFYHLIRVQQLSSPCCIKHQHPSDILTAAYLLAYWTRFPLVAAGLESLCRSTSARAKTRALRCSTLRENVIALGVIAGSLPGFYVCEPPQQQSQTKRDVGVTCVMDPHHTRPIEVSLNAGGVLHPAAVQL